MNALPQYEDETGMFCTDVLDDPRRPVEPSCPLIEKPSAYTGVLLRALQHLGITRPVDPRHLEAWMRLQYGCLDHLAFETFLTEVPICLACIDEAGVEASEQLARSQL